MHIVQKCRKHTYHSPALFFAHLLGNRGAGGGGIHKRERRGKAVPSSPCVLFICNRKNFCSHYSMLRSVLIEEVTRRLFGGWGGRGFSKFWVGEKDDGVPRLGHPV